MATLRQESVTLDTAALSAIFCDSIRVAQNFGVGYIWVDSLCIAQDDPADWAVESGFTDEVYGNSLFTIAATSSADGDMPFLGPNASGTREQYAAHKMRIARENGPGSRVLVRNFDAGLFPGMVDGPLERRAWAMQERALSVRSMIFTEGEVRWRCVSSFTYECTGKFVPSLHDLRTNKAINTLGNWHGLVCEYNARQLTYTTDKLPASSGIAAKFEPLFACDHVAGLWRDHLVFDLTWEDLDAVAPWTYVPELLMAPSLGNGVPSWSWASLQCRVVWRDATDFLLSLKPNNVQQSTPITCADVTTVDCRPETLNEFGEVGCGSFVDLRAKAVSAHLEADQYGFALLWRPDHEPIRMTLDCRLTSHTVTSVHAAQQISSMKQIDTSDDPRTRPSRVSAEVLCLLLLRGDDCVYVLVLGFTGEDPVTYQRLGTCNWDEVQGRNEDYEAWMKVPSWRESWPDSRFVNGDSILGWFDDVNWESYRTV